MEDTEDKIVELLHTGELTVREVAERTGVSRGKVSDVFKRVTGESYRSFKANLKKVEDEATQNAVKYQCSACGKPVTEADAKISLCKKCHHLQKVEGRLPHVLVPCAGCGVEFHPFRGIYYAKRKNKKYYHSRKCFLKSIKKK